MLQPLTHLSEERSDEAQRFFRATLDSLTSHIAILDENGIILEVNEAWRRFAQANAYGAAAYGVGADYLRGCESDDSGYSDGRTAAEGIRKVLAGQLPLFTMEYPCHSPNEKRWFHMRVTRFAPPGPVRAVVEHQNVTAEKLAAERLEALRFSIDRSGDPIYWLRPDQGFRVAFANAAAVRHFGYPEDELLRTTAPDWAPQFPPERCAEFWERLKAEGTIVFECVHRRQDGTLVPVEVSTNYFSFGGVEYITGSFRDISERKRAEEALREADRRKDEFLAVLGHELRNPLAPIRNAVQVLRLKGPPDPVLIQARDVIDRQAAHMTRLVDDLLEVSRITRGKIRLEQEPVDVAQVVAQAVETSRPLIEARWHELRVSLPDTPVQVRGDSVRLAQVISNLLNNAAKYTEVGGRIDLAAAREGAELVLTVTDTGVGIPPEMLVRVFDMFAQVENTRERAQGGLGIGLTLVRRLVEMHGGTVEAHSAGPGLGSRFVVHLPALMRAPDHRASVRPAGPDAAAARRRVLVVDDNIDSATSLRMLLRMWDHEVQLAHDGLTALTAARDFRPEVILLDIGLPKLDGLQVARQVRQEDEMAEVLLVAMTGYGQEEDRRRTQDAGFDHHLVKPVDLDTLQELLRAGAAPGRRERQRAVLASR